MKTFGEAVIAFRDNLATALANIGEWLGLGVPPQRCEPRYISFGARGEVRRPGIPASQWPLYAPVGLPAHWVGRPDTSWQCEWCGSSQAKDRLSCAKCGGVA